MRAALLLAALAAVPPARAVQSSVDCPDGEQRVETNDPLEPFRCEKVKRPGLSKIVGPAGFKFRPKCPRGTHPEGAGTGLQPYKCVPNEAADAEPDLATLRESGQAPPEAPAARGAKRKPDAEAPVPEAAQVLLGEDAYRRYNVPGELSFEYPRAFAARDSWQEDVPALTFIRDDGSPGKPVTLTVTRWRPGTPGFASLDEAAAKEIEWQGAKDAGTAPVAGVKARLVMVPGESRTAYVPLSRGGYLTVVYSAPAELFDSFRPAYERLLKTLRLAAPAR